MVIVQFLGLYSLFRLYYSLLVAVSFVNKHCVYHRKIITIIVEFIRRTAMRHGQAMRIKLVSWCTFIAKSVLKNIFWITENVLFTQQHCIPTERQIYSQACSHLEIAPCQVRFVFFVFFLINCMYAKLKLWNLRAVAHDAWIWCEQSYAALVINLLLGHDTSERLSVRQIRYETLFCPIAFDRCFYGYRSRSPRSLCWPRVVNRRSRKSAVTVTRNWYSLTSCLPLDINRLFAMLLTRQIKTQQWIRLNNLPRRQTARVYWCCFQHESTQTTVVNETQWLLLKRLLVLWRQL